MNLAIVSPDLDGYSETFIRQQIEHLPARVEILYGGELPVFSTDGSVLLPVFQRFANEILARLTSREREGIDRAMARAYPESLRARAMARHLSRRATAVVLAHYGPTGVAVMDACRRAGTPLVVHFHGYDSAEERVLVTVGRRYPELFQQAAAIIAVSESMRARLLALGAPESKLELNPYGINTRRFRPAEKPPLSEGCRFLGVGRFVEKKAPHLVLLAFSRVREELKDVHLTLVGDGPLLGSCKLLARALGCGDAVRFLGARPHAEVAELMGRSHVFVQHSVVAASGDREGTPVSVLEAGASALPCVATRHEGIADAVVHGVTGYLVEEGDVDGMARHMLELATNPEGMERMGAAARERIQRHYGMEARLRCLWRILQRASRKDERRTA